MDRLTLQQIKIICYLFTLSSQHAKDDLTANVAGRRVLFSGSIEVRNS